MNKARKTVAVTVGVGIIVIGIAAGIFAIMMESKKPEATPDDTPAETTVLHDDVEYKYNEDGTLVREVYYKDNVYDGQKDYFTEGLAEYEITLDKDRNRIAIKKTELNVVGGIIRSTYSEHGEVVELVEYDYDDDLVTVKKKTVKSYEGETELAEKTYFGENGKKTRVCKYKNGSLTEETFYDENGKVIENGGETVED